MKWMQIGVVLLAGTLGFFWEGALAWEGALIPLGISRNEAVSQIEGAFGDSSGLPLPRLSRSGVETFKAMSEQERVAVVKQGVAGAKGIVMSESFRQAADERVRKQYGGIDHGLKLPSAEELNRQMAAGKLKGPAYEQAMARMSAGRAAERAFRGYADSLRSTLEGDLRSAEYMAKEMPGQKPDPRKQVELLKAALALYGTDEQGFRRGAAAALSFRAGGPADPAEAETLAKEEQQRIYDEYAWKGKLRRGLSDFVETAAKVNFAAATTQKGSRLVFTDPTMERASAAQKFLYRMGKPAALAAVAEAKAWIGELQ